MSLSPIQEQFSNLQKQYASAIDSQKKAYLALSSDGTLSFRTYQCCLFIWIEQFFLGTSFDLAKIIPSLKGRVTDLLAEIKDDPTPAQIEATKNAAKVLVSAHAITKHAKKAAEVQQTVNTLTEILESIVDIEKKPISEVAQEFNSPYSKDLVFPESTIHMEMDPESGLTVTITAKNLLIRSITADDIPFYGKLVGDQEVMEKYADGAPQSLENISKRINSSWLKRWQKEHDPFSALVVVNKETCKRIGHIVMGHGDLPGISEIAYLFKKNSWGKGFGKEAVSTVIKDYSNALAITGYKLEGETLHTITATTREDNLASVKILEGVGMKQTGTEEKYGALRRFYSIKV